ncbi:serine/threonine-protein kinase [Hyalangium rubrum]|uniref:non-specific serine/threonine protein kinase n=1 Tax=Hyalangium rubrum TaxID=3103134 RepID=A0ABU5HEB4_9BACT|nr:serine/threonine-protein kinase [Hyalangium sp. s54d21]MDY7231459.1 serine/threonine-protein kinase [Hyalangium sp. s54d21]
MNTSYRLTGRIEAGELADLYKATQDSGGEVVVKLFHPKTSDPGYARVLAETSRVLNPLSHTGIVHYVDLGFVKERLAVVREHVDGYTLGTALQRLNTKEVLLPSPIALYLVIQLLETVQKAHEAEIVHGAITPGNLLLSRDGQPAICDFGALKALMAVPELKRTFATRGRSAYRAPEVTRGEEPTVQSDIYSLGSIAYELLTLREAIVTGNVSTRSGGLPPPSRIDRRINARLDPLILRALDPHPNRRFRSAGEFSGALRNFFAANGGMPNTEDLRRFVRELVPNEVNFSTLGPPAFTEPFKLTAVTGAEIAHLHAEIPEVSVVVRPSFSRSVSEEEFAAETQEAAPIFEEYKPEAYAPLEATRAGQPEPVAVAEDTSPSSVGPLEQAWEAPPGAAPPKAKKPAGLMMGTPGVKEGTFVGRNPRLKWVDDLSEEKTHVAEELQEPAASPPKAAPAARAAPPPAAPPPSARPPPSLVRTAPSKEPPAQGYVPRERKEIPMPPPTDASIRIGISGKRLFTEERDLRAMEQRKRSALGLASGIFLVGVIAFALAIWQLGATKPPAPAPKPDPRADAITGAVNQYVASPKPPEPKPAPPEVSPRKEPVDEPRPDPNSAFLTLRSNVPARVIIDGTVLSRRTPLVKYPVKPGTRHIVLEAVGTKERVEFEARFERGKNHTIEQKFDSTPRR